MNTATKKKHDATKESPTAWFAVLERARLTDDYTLAARAVCELERLGVTVRFTRKTSGGGRTNE